MKLEKGKAKGNLLSFEIKATPVWYANLLRRVFASETPTMAIELVEISRNDSILYDEIVAHRLGLVPLTTDLKGYSLVTQEEIDAREYLAKSSCKLTLEAKGPCVVLAKDLKSTDPKVKPVYPDMPITRLLEGQELRIVATAVLGIGRWHAKWAPAHTHYHRAGMDDTSKEEQAQDTSGAQDITFTIESWGQLKPAEIVEAGIDRYTQQLKEFDTLLAGARS